MIGKLRRVPLRTVWAHEAHDFTVWLQDNIDVLNESLGLSLDNAEREQSAGSFNVDLVAEDGSGQTVIIENQLERSDHDHLGKLLTYLTAFDAAVAIWIVADPRPEHVRAIGWLNESTAADFHLVKVEAVQISDSAPAAMFTQIVGPSIEAKRIGKTKKELSERHHIRAQFWESFLEIARQKTKLFSNVSPSAYNWIGTTAGKSGVQYICGLRQNSTRIEFGFWSASQELNKARFDFFHQKMDEVEASFGDALMWDRMDSSKGSAIRINLETGGYRNPENEWPLIQKGMVETLIKFEKAFKPIVKQLP